MRISSILRIFLNSKLSGSLVAALFVSLLALPGASMAAGWPMFLKDPSHSGIVEDPPSVPLSLLWKFDTAGPIYSSPVVAGDTVFIASYDKVLYALNAATGELKWKFETSGEILSTPSVLKGVLYFGSKDGWFYAIDANTGKLTWKYEVGSPILTSPVLGMGFVFFGAADTYFYALDTDDGERVWRAKLKENTKYGGIYSSPAYRNGAVFIASKNRDLYSYDAETGARNWVAHTKSAIYSSPVLDDADRVYIASFDRKLYAYNIEDGSPVFRRSLGAMPYSTLTISGDSIYIGLKNSKIQVHDLYSGKKTNSFSLPDAVNSSIVIDFNGVIYAGCADGYIYLIDSISGTVLSKYKTGGGIHSSPAIAGGKLYIGSKDGSLYAFE